MEPEASDARVFARPLKSCAVDDVGLVGDVGPELENAGRVGEKLAEDVESCDCDLEVIGTVRLLTSDVRGIDEACEGVRAISGGISSGAGIGKLRAAATNCASVHELEWSLSPLQNGASRRSILKYCQLGLTYHPAVWLTCNCLTTALS